MDKDLKCICGVVTTEKKWYNHIRTKKHENFIIKNFEMYCKMYSIQEKDNMYVVSGKKYNTLKQAIDRHIFINCLGYTQKKCNACNEYYYFKHICN